ncbi:putative glycosyltransferase [Tieghemostelium lacteum]|uniref:Putative glycosyltransferase n=1 Tax=Tieghemostelium lacteum TaxID=361077 RepID=A0A151Z587_TIELA|nr:putative glycosyltransferase [Tieghemostelium lacteum]|eukprot:KYQ88964.1 putative glycosyltransferase [Tieghemostelium lacteum]
MAYLGSSTNSLTTNKPFTKIFCPNRCVNQKSGYLIGLNTSSFVLCIVDIVSDIPLNELEIILNKMSFDQRILNSPLGGYAPKVIGEWVGYDKVLLSSPNNLHELDIWISMERSDQGDPVLRKIVCNEYKFQTSTQIVLHDDTSPYYYTSIPIKFESYFENLQQQKRFQASIKGSRNSSNTSAGNSVFAPKGTTSSSSSSSSSTTTSIIDSKKKQSDLESFLKQINCTNDIKIILKDCIQKYQQRKKQQEESLKKSTSSTTDSDTDSESTSNPSLFSKTLFTLKFRGSKSKASNSNNTSPTTTQVTSTSNSSLNSSLGIQKSSTSTSPTSSTNLLKNSNTLVPPQQQQKPQVKKKTIRDYLLLPWYFFIWILRLVLKLTEKILNLSTPFDNSRLKDLTTLGTHLDNRILQIKELYHQWQYLANKKYWTNNNQDRATFIEFHNTCWLLLNDMVLGILVGFILNYYCHSIIQIISKLNFYVNNDLFKSLILWIMGWPGGFKLNENLDNFFGRLILYYIDKWNLITTTISPHGVLVLKIISVSGIFGVSFFISVLVDLFYIFSMHVTVFYGVSARFYLLQLRLLNSLWNLFRGKKFNPLRKRIDSVDFDVNQLLLGTLLFTLIFFLFPTTIIYYFFLAMFKSIVSIVQGLFVLLLHLINTFPLFNLLIYLMDPKYIPGGVTICLKHQKSTSPKIQSQTPNSNTLQSPTIPSSPSTTPTLLNSPKTTHHTRNLSGTLLPLLNEQKSPIPIGNSSNSNNNSNYSSSSSSVVKFNIPSQPTSPNTTGSSIVNIKYLNSNPHHHHHHRRNLSLSTQNSPIPRVGQLEITYFTIKIQPSGILSFFAPTIQLFQYVLNTYRPGKLIKGLFTGSLK